MSSNAITFSLATSALASLYLVWRLWRSNDHLFFKIALTAIAFIPFLGPLLVFWISNFTKSQAAVFQDKYRFSTDVFDRWRHVIEEKNPHSRFQKWRELIGRNNHS